MELVVSVVAVNSYQTTDRLSPMERAALKLGELVNESTLSKKLQWGYLSTVHYAWMLPTIRRIAVTEGMSNWTMLRPDRGVLMAVNHRTFFDCYFISTLMIREAPWYRELYFPVRKNFFYDNPAGVAVNFMMSAGCMYPPVFRDGERRAHNAMGVDKLVAHLQRPGVVVGMHPEGKRSKSPDPYTLLPAKPGIGQLIVRARPTVLPCFVNGLAGDLVEQVAAGIQGKKTRAIIAVFGEPMDVVDRYPDLEPNERYKRIAQDVNDEVARLGQKEKVLRERLLSGENVASN
jgi:1-acyl-sn-glycerol-3-phosphate acyltransferase